MRQDVFNLSGMLIPRSLPCDSSFDVTKMVFATHRRGYAYSEICIPFYEYRSSNVMKIISSLGSDSNPDLEKKP